MRANFVAMVAHWIANRLEPFSETALDGMIARAEDHFMTKFRPGLIAQVKLYVKLILATEPNASVPVKLPRDDNEGVEIEVNEEEEFDDQPATLPM